MKPYTVIACVPPDYAAYLCPDCCPEPDKCEVEHGALFADSETDCPEHCDKCGAFLGNALTSDGIAYVRERLAEGSCVTKEWQNFYRLELEGS